MFEKFKAKVTRAKYVALAGVASGMAAIGMALPASATVDFSAITDLLNVTFDVLDIVVANGSTLIEIIVLFATLGLVGIIIYGFIGKLLAKIGGMNMGGKGGK